MFTPALVVQQYLVEFEHLTRRIKLVHRLKTLDSKTLLYLVGIFAILGAAEARAQDDEAEVTTSRPKLRAGGFIGGNYLSSENELGNSFFDDQVPESGFLIGARGSYRILDSISPESELNPQLHIELEGKYTFSSTAGGVSGRESITTPVFGWRAHLLMDFFPDKKLVPFAMIGVGGETAFGANTFMTSPDTDLASYYGGGLRYPITDKLDFRGDVRVGLTASRGDGFAGLAEIHVGLSYNFGNSTTAAEEADEPVEDSAETLPDSDRDGIADINDACPQTPENINGVDDTDGCPEEDSDNDGLLGSKDKCPDAAEDVDGFEDQDGCPDADNDDDGRPDVVDQCPDKPETKNGYKDDDGCPDEVPAAVQKFTGSIRGIVFKTGSARILRKSKTTLLQAFQVLSDNPTVRIEISGHTDNKGRIESNRDLSRKRADYVKWFLVDRGIAADRIETVGHGPDKPLGDNNTDAGRQENRRIEFRLLSSKASPVTPAAATSGAVKAPKTVSPKAKKRNGRKFRKGKGKGRKVAKPAAKGKAAKPAAKGKAAKVAKPAAKGKAAKVAKPAAKGKSAKVAKPAVKGKASKAAKPAVTAPKSP